MSDRNLEYLVNYIGPVIFVKKDVIKYKDEKRSFDTCTNKKCSEHGKAGPVFHGSYCVKCGHETDYILAKTGLKYEVYPISLDDTFDNNYVFINNKYSNGISILKNSIQLADNEDIYSPYFEAETFDCGILAHVELGKYCKNKECEEFDECAPASHDYCSECGKKNKLHVSKDIYSSFPKKKAKKLLGFYSSNSNMSTCVFIEDSEFNEVVDKFTKSKMCKKGLAAIEKAYGKGSASVRLAFVQYHQNY